MKILILSGGKSAERDISIVSAAFIRNVLENSGHIVLSIEIDPEGRWFFEGGRVSIETGHPVWKLISEPGELIFDVLFPALHGPFGEDGSIQGLCENAGWAYTGADVMTSAVAMNKITTKIIASASGIPVLPWKSFSSDLPLAPHSMEPLRFPVFVKPARMGSSIGISRVGCSDELEDAFDLARRFDSMILMENGLEDAREIEVALLSESGVISSSVPGEIVPGLEWYDYEAKYGCSDSRLIVPAPLEPESAANVRRYAEKIFSVLNGSGFARADFLVHGRDIYFNEINTIPGFTEISMFAKLWEATGVSNSEVMERILSEALRRHAERSVEVNRVEIP